jgi:hypothetical protein
MPSPTHPEPLGLAVGQYTSTADIKAALQAHARDNWYAIATDSGTLTRAGWICSKSGKYNDQNKSHNVHLTKRRRNTRTTKTRCEFRVRATYDKSNAIWTSVVVNANHNHDAVVLISALPHH